MNGASNLRLAARKSLSPAKTTSPLKSPLNTNSNNFYFYHYRNAMYMGGVKNFRKDGKGILIHDNGLSVVCQHFNDLMHGHNIFYSQHCLLSA